MSQSGYEKSDVNVTKLTIISLLSIGFVIVSIIILNEMFLAEKENLIQERVLSVESEDLIKLHEREAVELSSYKLIDSTTGRYQIPIERAMELIIEESKASNRNQ